MDGYFKNGAHNPRSIGRVISKAIELLRAWLLRRSVAIPVYTTTET